jgi:hypothetical protein
MKKITFAAAFVVMLCLMISPYGVSADGAVDPKMPVFVGFPQSAAVIEATSKEIELPTFRVVDRVDVNLSYTVTVHKASQEFAVKNNRVRIDELGEYTVRYTAVNSRGEKTEKNLTVEVVDNTAPIVSFVTDTVYYKAGVTYSLPGITAADFYDTEVTAALRDGAGNTQAMTDAFTLDDGDYRLVYTVKERRDGGLQTVFEIAVLPVARYAVYGFDDFGERNSLDWLCIQSDLNTFDPLAYQVPSIEQNTESSYVRDDDGRSFKITVNGKTGCDKNNSWPAISTSGLKLPALFEHSYLVFWVYNATEADGLTVCAMTDFSNIKVTKAVAAYGQWTQVKIPLGYFKNSWNFRIYIDGFETGVVQFYLDDMYLI